MKDAIIILSGGLDSVVMLYEFKDRISTAIYFSYGSKHTEKEKSMAEYHCKLLCIELKTVELGFFSKLKSALLGNEEMPTGDRTENEYKKTVVPFRNGVLLSIACAIAEDMGMKFVYTGIHPSTGHCLPDCSIEFAQSMSKAMETGTFMHIRLLSPYADMQKSEIVRRGHYLGVDMSKTYSCYKGKDNHCGVCGACKERKIAFEQANIKDNTIYNE